MLFSELYEILFLNCSALFHGQMLFNRPMVVRMVTLNVIYMLCVSRRYLLQDRDAPTQVDPSLLKLSMRLDSLVKSGAVHLDPGVLPMEEPIHAPFTGGLAPLSGLYPPPSGSSSSSSALLREQQFQEELAELQRRQRARDAMEVEMLIKRHFGGGDRSLFELAAGMGLHGSDLLDKERHAGGGGLGGMGSYHYDNALDIGRSSLGSVGNVCCWNIEGWYLACRALVLDYELYVIDMRVRNGKCP